jgi:hypothetical protein
MGGLVVGEYELIVGVDKADWDNSIKWHLDATLKPPLRGPYPIRYI